MQDKIDSPPPPSVVDYSVQTFGSKESLFEPYKWIPSELREETFFNMAKKLHVNYSHEVHVAIGAYTDHMFSNMGVLESVDLIPFKYFY